jgi:thiopeptide-type bacteriocin biosynthesis protein
VSTSAPASHSWTSFHAFIHDAEEVDRFLLEAVEPAVSAMLERDGASEWFFIRYWAGGPHVRLRVRAPKELAGGVESAIGQWLGSRQPAASAVEPAEYYARFGTSSADGLRRYGWHGDHEVERAPYEPEVARYGGKDGLAISERFFQQSSEVALAVMRRTPERARRTSVALDLLHAFTIALGLDDLAAVGWLRSYASSWSYNAEGAAVDVPAVRHAAEREYLGKQEAYSDRFTRFASALRQAGSDTTLPAFWYSEVQRCVHHYQELHSAGRLTVPPNEIMKSQVHMFHNRMGVFISEECYLSWLASLIVAQAHPAADYFADGPEAADRRYHESSKFFPWRTEQQPRGGYSYEDPIVRWPGQPVISLPEPSAKPGIAGRPFDEVILARRSAYGLYGGPLILEELSALLKLGAGVATTVPFAPEGVELYKVAKRTYPSAGARYPMKVFVYPRDVPGVKPAVYVYDCIEHSLRLVGPAPENTDLLRCSPLLDPNEAPAIRAEDVPLWLFPVADLSYQRAKYGLRAYRLTVLECGHLAQNLWLVATALGLSTITLAAFLDDSLNQLLMIDGVGQTALYMMPVGRTDPSTNDSSVARGS